MLLVCVRRAAGVEEHTASELVLAGKEVERLARTDHEGKSRDKEDLVARSAGGPREGAYVAERAEGAVEEHDDTQHHEERAEGGEPDLRGSAAFATRAPAARTPISARTVSGVDGGRAGRTLGVGEPHVWRGSTALSAARVRDDGGRGRRADGATAQVTAKDKKQDPS